jgi:hypothetical protein
LVGGSIARIASTFFLHLQKLEIFTFVARTVLGVLREKNILLGLKVDPPGETRVMIT